eukprot:Gregarina_sp_Poly_1__10743@NODE_819_length_6147_cov_44_607072_g593_i0_p2_GENE_NODE_819_length_6147_cov_44_607072_g593_i0NODE_819_length_6147_cov_44_607072_g593_i0_p2_ORF_typecomplete_len384_score39_23CAF1/PF04857_20/1_7e47_NODE_819_length_6147_cov_44_607072_g593_i017752926
MKAPRSQKKKSYMGTKRLHDSAAKFGSKSDRHRRCLDDAIEEISRSEFVALDLEFSGLCLTSKKYESPEDYYQFCVESIPNFLAVELGICCVRRSQENINEWIFSPFNFHLYPSKRTLFFSDSLSLSWLIQQGFDIQKWVEDGYDYKALAYLQDESHSSFSSSTVKNDGAQRVISAIIEAEKPLILHNGLLDILHVYQKFITDLPQQWRDICQHLCDFFSGGIYDTKRIAFSEQSKFFGDIPLRISSASLESLRQHFAAQPTHLDFRLFSNEKWLNNIELYKAGIYTSKSSELLHKQSTGLHEGGFGALITAQIFLSQLEALHRDRNCDEGFQQVGEIIPRTWRDSPACRNVENSFHLPGSHGIVQLPTIKNAASHAVVDVPD